MDGATASPHASPTLARVRWPLLVGAAALLALAVWWLGRREETQGLQRWETRLTSVARGQVAAVSLWADERAADARALGLNPLVSAWAADEASAPGARAWLQALQTAHQYQAVLVETDGKHLAAGVLPSDFDQVAATLPPGAPGALQWHVRDAGDELRVLLRHHTEGPMPVTVTLVMDPRQKLFPLLADSAFGTQTGTAFLVAQEGKRVNVFPDYADEAAELRALPAASQELVRYVNAAGVPVLASAQKEPNSGWVLMRGVHLDEVLRPARQAQQLFGALGTLLFVALFLGLRVLTARQQHRATEQRLAASHRELEQLRLKEKARSAESRAARLARLLDDTSAEVYVLNAQTLMVEEANKVALTALGLDLATLTHRTPLDLSPGHEPEQFRQRYEELRSGARQEWRYECEHQRRDGTRYPVEVTTRYSTSEPVPVFVSVAIDISKRRQLEEMLRQSQKLEAVGRLAGGVAHDFNNILTVIVGSGVLALEKLPAQSDERGEVEEMVKAAHRAAALTTQLLAFSRRQIIQPKVASVGGIVEGLRPMLTRLLGEDVELVVALAPGRDFVRVDPGQFEQVITNLSINARDAMPQGGRLTLETELVQLDETYAREHPTAKVGPHVMLALSDTGMGMDAQTRARIFEPFFTTKEAGRGTGLGLATVFGIVKQSGGNIWVYSEPGQGTTFKVYLPAVGEAEKESKVEELPLEPVARGSETVLLVEDDATIRRLAARALEANGHKVLQAGNGEEALTVAQAEDGPIHLLLTDVVMPRMGGRALAERLLTRRPRMRVLYMSGFTDDAIMHRNVLEAGVDFLQKPFAPRALLMKVRAVLDRA